MSNTAEQNLADIFQRHGSVVITRGLHPNLRNGMTEQIERWERLTPDVNTVILDSLSFNAVATRHNGSDFVGVYAGALLHIAAFAYAIFSDPTMFPNVGNSSIEKPNPIVIDSLRDFDISYGTSERYLPLDPVRLEAAQRISECAYLILFCHEICHIRGCHIEPRRVCRRLICLSYAAMSDLSRAV